MNITHPADIIDERLKEIKARWGRGKELSIDFLPTLDNKIWGLQKQKMVLIAGRPSMGKSSLMIQMAYSFARQGKKVMFFSLEMSNKVCMDRLLACHCEIDNYMINTGKLVEVEKLYQERIDYFKHEAKDVNLALIESWGKTFDEIFKAINTVKDSPDVVFIDYINMVKQGFRSKRDAIDEYIKKLREFAMDRNFCVIVGCQINRDAHKNKNNTVAPPRLWQLKEAGELEEHTDMAFLLHYPFFYTRESEDLGKYYIDVAKNREGRTGSFECVFEPEFYKFKEVSNENT